MDWFRCCGFIIIAMWENEKRKKKNIKRVLNISKARAVPTTGRTDGQHWL